MHATYPIGHRELVALLALALGACAGTPSRSVTEPSADARHGSTAPGIVELRMNGALPTAGVAAPAVFSSDLAVGGTDAALRYRASYSVLPGDVVTAIGTEIDSAPTAIARQRTRQQVTLRSPVLASAPVTLDLSTETTGNWTTKGYRFAQRERAELRWSSSVADFRLQWAGAGSIRDQSLALDCDLQGSMRVPVVDGGSRSAHAVTLSGRDCRVRASRSHFDQLTAQQFGLGYQWQPATHRNELRFSVINPTLGVGDAPAGIRSGYELGLSHSREHGAWRANARVALRQPAVLDHTLIADAQPLGAGPGDVDAMWNVDTSLMRDWRLVSLSASWLHGADPLWFVHQAGARTDRIGVALDFSGWLNAWWPQLQEPQVAMRARWAQSRAGQPQANTGSELQLSMSMRW